MTNTHSNDSEPTVGFEPTRPTSYGFTDPDASGPTWKRLLPSSSLDRISYRESLPEVQAQALTEAVILLHSVRRILIWTLVIVPIIAVIVGGILAGVMISELAEIGNSLNPESDFSY